MGRILKRLGNEIVAAFVDFQDCELIVVAEALLASIGSSEDA